MHQLLLVIIVAVNKRETSLPVRSPVSVHLIVNIQRNNTSIILQLSTIAAAGSTRKGGKNSLLGWIMMLIVTVHSVNCVRHMEQQHIPWMNRWCMDNKAILQLEESYITEKMKAHTSSDSHIQANQAALAHLTTQHTGSVIQQLQNVAEQEVMLNKKAIKYLICLAHLLCSPTHSSYYKFWQVSYMVGW